MESGERGSAVFTKSEIIEGFGIDDNDKEEEADKEEEEEEIDGEDEETGELATEHSEM